MSRSGYIDDHDDQWELIRWRGAVASATRGKRGQRLLRELLAALDAMPKKRLIAEELVADDGEVCALGALAVARGIPGAVALDPEDSDAVATAFGIAQALAREIVWENDEATYWRQETPEQRWERMRKWVASQIRENDEGKTA